MLSWDSEGTLVADWLQRPGVAAFVLKYRLSDTGAAEEFAEIPRHCCPALQQTNQSDYFISILSRASECSWRQFQ
jgi:hypothetical protein